MQALPPATPLKQHGYSLGHHRGARLTCSVATSCESSLHRCRRSRLSFWAACCSLFKRASCSRRGPASATASCHACSATAAVCSTGGSASGVRGGAAPVRYSLCVPCSGPALLQLQSAVQAFVGSKDASRRSVLCLYCSSLPSSEAQTGNVVEAMPNAGGPLACPLCSKCGQHSRRSC